MRNDGTESEKIFKDKMKAFGKSVFLYRIPDTKEATRGGKRKTNIMRSTPSDFIITWNSVMAYAEVKSTSNPTLFSFSNFRKDQLAAMRMQIAAGGNYWIFIHCLDQNKWYWIYGQDVIKRIDKNIKSMKWSEMGPEYVFANYTDEEQ